MPTTSQTELQSFHEFVGRQFSNGGSNLSPEQVLLLWRERQETIAAIQRGFDDLEAGRVKPLREVLDRLGRD
jgi:hypothetical protein